MRSDLSDVTLVVDRSGSMEVCREDAEGGVNQFIRDQKEQKGDCTFTLVQFDTKYEFVHKGVPVEEVGPFELVPRGRTALLDAVGQAINETGERLAAMVEEHRPGLVVFVIVTDGQENSSREFTWAQIKRMIERQEREYSWKFTFLGANQDAFVEAEGIGISAPAAAAYAVGRSQRAFAAASSSVGRMRRAASAGAILPAAAFTDEERKDIGGSDT